MRSAKAGFLRYEFTVSESPKAEFWLSGFVVQLPDFCTIRKLARERQIRSPSTQELQLNACYRLCLLKKELTQ